MLLYKKILSDAEFMNELVFGVYLKDDYEPWMKLLEELREELWILEQLEGKSE